MDLKRWNGKDCKGILCKASKVLRVNMENTPFDENQSIIGSPKRGRDKTIQQGS
jgi:hypothetical protein